MDLDGRPGRRRRLKACCACGQIDATDATRMRLYAGGGIMAASDPHAELVETDAKFSPMKAALRETL